MVAITIHPGQMAKLVRACEKIKNGVPRVLAPAINRALSSGRTVVRREIRKEYLIKSKDIPIRIQGASRGSLSGAIIIQSGMLPLSKFRVKPRGVTKRKRALFGQVKKGGGGTLGRAFNTYGGGGPFARTGDTRLPIKRLMTIGAPIMASQPSVGPETIKKMGETLEKRIDHEMKRVLASAG